MPASRRPVLLSLDESFLDALVPPDHLSTPGYSDLEYPITGQPAGG